MPSAWYRIIFVVFYAYEGGNMEEKKNEMLSIVVPCYNEEETVEPLFEETLAVMRSNDIDFEFIFINDGSSDSTLQKLCRLAKDAPCAVKIVDFSRNFGKEAGIYAGLEHSSGDYAVIMDGDMQQSPEVVVEMLNFLRSNPEYDCVTAFQEKRRESAVMRFFKSAFYKLINKASSIDFVPDASDFRLMRRPMVDAVLSLSEYFRFSKGIFSYVGFRTHYMPYIVRARGGGETKWSFAKLFRYAMDGIIGFTTAPLKFTTFAGLAASAAAFIYLIVVVVQKLFFSIDVPGYATIVCLILLLGGLQLLGIGILGEYLGRNYVETKKRPLYICRKVIDNQNKEKK